MGREVIEVFTDRDEAQRLLIDMLRGPYAANQPRCERGVLYLPRHNREGGMERIIVWTVTMWVKKQEVQVSPGCAA